MLETIYRNKSTIKQLRDGPLGGYPDELVQHYLNLGYSEKHMTPRFGPLSKFNKLLVNKGLSLREVDEKLIEEFIQQCIQTNKSFYSSGANLLFTRFIDLLVRDGILHPQKLEPSFGSKGVNSLLIDYKSYLKSTKGLTATSIDRFSNIACSIVVDLNISTIPKLGNISAKEIQDYIISFGERYSTKHIQLIASSLRCFLKYLFMKGVTRMDLAVCIPTLPGYRAVHLPEYLEVDQLTKLLKSCDQKTVVGSRNLAVLLLLCRVGVRASEVMNLKLKDIDWRIGEFTILGKGGRQSVMPLLNEVGEAISDYLANYRPRNRSPYVFLTIRPPHRKFNNPSTVSTIVQRQLETAGIKTTAKGAHLLRYTAATNCLRNGGSLYEVSELLRHLSIDTTAIYAKVDIERLSQLALPWPASEVFSHV